LVTLLIDDLSFNAAGGIVGIPPHGAVIDVFKK